MRNLRKASAWPSDEFGLYPITTRLLDPRSPPPGSVTHRTDQVGPPSSNRDTLHNITALLTTTNRLHNRPLVMDDLWKSRRRIKNAGNKRHRKKMPPIEEFFFLYHIILNSLNQFKRYSKIFHFQNLSQIREDFFSKNFSKKNNYFFLGCLGQVNFYCASQRPFI